MIPRREALALAALSACGPRPPAFAPEDAQATTDSPRDATAVDTVYTPPPTDAPVVRRDTGTADLSLAPDAACVGTMAQGVIERRPVDIVWIVDNSVSMAPAIDQVILGLNTFAGRVGTRGIDYRVALLSLRSPTRDVRLADGTRRYGLCIPRPLAGDDRCGNGPRFLHASMDVRSTQPLEQLLGSLMQTQGYAAGESRGGEPWRAFLRAGASKTFVVVTDDNSRMPAREFERFPGGVNPRSSTLRLPPGVLDPSYGGLFEAYTFSGIYGYGSDTDPSVPCRFPDGTMAPASGAEYTALVGSTRGVRARLCDGARAWGPFFDAVATAVERTSMLACDLAIPAPPDGSVLDPDRVNVALVGEARTALGRVGSVAACGPAGGWYYNDPRRPDRVHLCPASCARAQALLAAGGRAGVEVQFGCLTIPG
ncbi:MAG: hypothetical protein HY909_06130 [Deltaproteobacteria bacterium]|nr:hypothetical protein [Deltaproteobacteria bacterium]